MHAGDGLEDRLRVQGQPVAAALEFVGQHVQQHFGVRMRVDVATVAAEHLLAQLFRVGQVAVVGQDDAVRRAHVERLGFFLARGGAGRRVAHLADAGRARQAAHVAGAEHIAHEAVGLVHVEGAAVGRGDAGCILSAVLQQQQAVIDQLVDRAGGNHADDTAHAALPGKATLIQGRGPGCNPVGGDGTRVDFRSSHTWPGPAAAIAAARPWPASHRGATPRRARIVLPAAW
ncbi:hypothetical protein D3C85_1081780 [compost metagenome]